MCSCLSGLAHIHVFAIHVIAFHTLSSVLSGNTGCSIVYKKTAAKVTDVLFSPLSCHYRLQVATNLVFRPSRISVSYFFFSFCTPGICLATWLQPLVISSLPSNLMDEEGGLSRDPPYLSTHDTAVTLFPLNSAGSPSVSDLSCKMT